MPATPPAPLSKGKRNVPSMHSAPPTKRTKRGQAVGIEGHVTESHLVVSALVSAIAFYASHSSASYQRIDRASR